MNMTPLETSEYLDEFLPLLGSSCECDVVLIPPFTSLAKAADGLRANAFVGLGAQNVHPELSGAFTGEVSLPFLKPLNVTYVIIGHSERRQYFQESDEFINRKVLSTVHAGLTPILCIGETLEERDAGKLEEVCRRQLEQGLASVEPMHGPYMVVAYEPVWAIGTGRTASPEQAQEAHAFVRKVLGELFGHDTSAKVRIQYGGSMKPGNAAELMAQPDVDGGLVGGASLDPESFFQIVKAAEASGQ